MALPRFLALVTLTTAIFGQTSLVGANSASPLPVEVQQPSGEPVTLFLRGTEKLHWYEFVPEAAGLTRAAMENEANVRLANRPGYTVVQDEAGRYVYARLDEEGDWAPTDQVVGAVEPPDIERRLLPPPEVMQRMALARLPESGIPARAAAPVGIVKNLVVLMRFSDHQGRTLPTSAELTTLFNAPGGDPALAPTGSIHDFYRENSYGRLSLESTVVGWLTLPRTEAYYANGESGLTVRIREAMIDALNIIRRDNLVNFADFDNENGGLGDGWIDAITFVHSGYAAEFGGTAGGANFKDRIWSHRWVINTWTDPQTGVKVRDYNINPGLWGTSGSSIGRIGVICHEIGHFFGLPDLYDYSGVGEGAGSWCLMANSWGFDGTQRHPPRFSAWCQIFLGWNTAEIVSEQKTYSVPSSALDDAKIYRVDYPSGSPDEYLLIENRQPIGHYDGGIPSGTGGRGGLAIWHIDDAKTENDTPGHPGQPGWPGNGKHYWVGLLQADSNYDLEKGVNRGDGNDLYRAGHVEAILDSTVPSNSSYTGISVLAIQKISVSDRVMTFQYGDGSDDEPSGPSDAVWAGRVGVVSPTSHVSNFSPDGKAATILFDQLLVDVQGDPATKSTVASFVLPVKHGTTPAQVSVDVRGYVTADEGSNASLVMQAAGRTFLIDLEASQDPSRSALGTDLRPESQKHLRRFRAAAPAGMEGTDFYHRLVLDISLESDLTVSFVLIAEKQTKASQGAFLVIDSLDVEILP